MTFDTHDASTLEALAQGDSTRWLIGLLFEGLARQERGLGVLYDVLDEVAKRYELSDVLVVLDHDELGTQVFRRQGQGVESSSLWRDDLEVGLYSDLSLPDEVRECTLLACRLAFATHVALYGRDRDTASLVATEQQFLESLDGACARSQRYGWAFTLVLFEVHGRGGEASEAGERASLNSYVLRRFALTLRESVRRGDQVARLGPTRFAVLLQAVEWGEFWSFVERVRLGWRRECPDGDFFYGTSASPRDAVSAEEILQTAEQRLIERSERGIR